MEIIDVERIPQLSNQELFQTLREYNLTVGPITDTTRSLYEKKLKLHLNTIAKSAGRSAKLQQQQKQQKENDEYNSTRSSRSSQQAVEPSKKYQADVDTYHQVAKQPTKSSSRHGLSSEPLQMADTNVILGNISNSSSFEQQPQQQQQQKRQQNTHEDVRFIRSSDLQSQSFSQASSSSSSVSSYASARYSTPQVLDKFANRLNSYGLLKPDTANNSINLLKRDKSPVRRSLPIESFNRQQPATTTRQQSPLRQQPQQLHKSPDNIKIFPSSIVRDNSPVRHRLSAAAAAAVEPKKISPRSRKSPENHKIFANSIIRDNSPDDVPVYQQQQQEQQQVKQHDSIVNWKYLAAVAFVTIFAFLMMPNLFSNDEI